MNNAEQMEKVIEQLRSIIGQLPTVEHIQAVLGPSLLRVKSIVEAAPHNPLLALGSILLVAFIMFASILRVGKLATALVLFVIQFVMVMVVVLIAVAFRNELTMLTHNLISHLFKQ